MKIRNVEIQNFMAIGSAQVKLADRGLVLIQGENDDETSANSNGAGKSSIADAVSWCLYGVTARGEDGDKVVNRVAGKDCYVEVVIEEGSQSFHIRRYRKHKVGKNGIMISMNDIAASVSADLTKGTNALTQKEIERIVGCSVDVFNGAVYAGQERMPDLPGMTDKNLKMLIEEASGATLLEAAYQEANKRLREKQIIGAGASTALDRSKEMVTLAESDKTTAEQRRDKFTEDRKTTIGNWHADFTRGKAELAELEADLPLRGDKVKIAVEITKIDTSIAAISAEQIEERRLTDLAVAAGRVHDRYGTEIDQLQRHLRAHKAKLDALDHQIGCPCGTCDRPFTADDIEPAKKLAAAEVEKAENAIADATFQKDAAFKRVTSAADARDAYRASMTDVSALSTQRSTLQTKLTAIERAEGVIESKKADLALLARQMKAKAAELNPYADDVLKAVALIDSRKAAVEKAELAIVDADRDVRVAESIAKVFSPAGVRAFLLDEVTPFLNDQTAKYLGTLSDGHISATWTTLIKTAKGELREKFSIEVTSSTGGETFAGISGGEKRKVRIACALALQDLVARRASKPIELFIGDEIDDALDDAGRQRLMDILQEKAKERGSVFIISHSDLKDWIRNQVTVKKSGGKATIEEVEA